ncbi:helix-turn-helix domain-containing protein [Undibacterium sp. Ji22W]|uniref:helix-turn-helix domain-containing protein n=1 Tax=Undibacterium sp. Ji22W TaxID=3413038 RepID=UPI003BEFF771
MNDVMQTATPVLQEEKMVPENASFPTTTGGQLAASRQARNWTVQFVAEQLKLSQVQIVALESDNFDVLPKMVIVRGFVRAYAKLLKINGDGLVASLPRDTEPVQLEASLRPALSTPFIDSRLSLQGQHDNNRRYIIGAITLLIIVGLFLLLQATEFGKNFGVVFEKKDVPVAVLSTATPGLMESTAATELPVTQTAAQSSKVQGGETTTSVSDVASEKSVPTIEAVPVASERNKSASALVLDEKAATNATPISLPPVAELFVLKFRQDSWIQVKTESGTILSSHLAKAGTEESFSVKQALNVKIGNAAGVDAILRGEPLSILSDRGNNVANLVVK